MPHTPTGHALKNKGAGILHALLPGAHIDKHTNKILVHTGTNNEIITFNVGGTKFETYRSTLRALPNSPLSNDAFLEKHYRPDHGDYFFDRDPAIFHCVLNFLRNGELHLSSSACGPVVKSELEYWGVDELDIEECCWSRYSNWASTLQALRKLEEDRAANIQFGEYPLKEQPSLYTKVCSAIWKFFSDPTSSKAAQWYAYFSLFIISVSIFSFIVQTHDTFKVWKDFEMKNSSYVPDTSNNSSNATSNEFYIETRRVPHESLIIIDYICLAYLLAELLLRLAVSPSKIRFITLPITIIEFLALVPDMVDAIVRLAVDSVQDYDTFAVGLNFLKLLRIMRVLRLIRHVPGLWILFYTLKSSIKDLLLLLMFVSVGMLISASLVYYAERDEQAESFSSIPKCMWWSLITMTTVGYGDMSPKTDWGYLVGAVTSIAGVLMVGFTVPVLVNNFIMYYNHTMSTMQRDKHNKGLPPPPTPSFSMFGNFGKTVLGSAGDADNASIALSRSRPGSKRVSGKFDPSEEGENSKGDRPVFSCDNFGEAKPPGRDSNDNEEPLLHHYNGSQSIHQNHSHAHPASSSCMVEQF